MKLRTKLFLAWSSVVLMLWAPTLWQVRQTVKANFDRVADESFAATRKGIDAMQSERRKQMSQAGWLLMNVPELRALIAEASSDLSPANVASLNERLDSMSDLLNADMVCVVSSRGSLIAQNTGSPFTSLSVLAEHLSHSAQAMALVRSVLTPGRAAVRSSSPSVHGLWVHDKRLFHVVGIPLIFGDEHDDAASPIDGAMLLANQITEARAAELRTGSNCEISFIVNGSVAASTLPAELIPQLESGLPTLQTANATELSLGDASYRSWLEPLTDPCSQTEVGSMLIQMSEAELHSAFAQASRVMLAILGTGLLLVALASFAVSTAVTLPIAALLNGVRQVAEGNLDWQLEVKRRDEVGALANAFNNMVGQLRSRRELEKQVEQSHAANLAKTQFLANMSHEIRTPLNGVVGMTQLLETTPLNDQQRRYASVIRKSAEVLTSLINDVLDLSKIEAGKMELESISFSPAVVVREAVELLAEKARQKRLEVRIVISHDVPRNVMGDPNRLRQVILNLLNNAIKFTERGYVEIKVECKSCSESQVKLQFSIKDTGIGIPADRLDRLFKSFSQVDASTTRKHGGTGLGLSICKQIIELMHGEIGVNTIAGAGSTFWFTAAFTPEHVQHATANPAANSELHERQRDDIAMASEAGRSRGRVLLAEDNEINQLVVSEMLANAGFECDIVADGAKAVEAVRSHQHYDLLLMDCQMPVMDGFAATQSIRKFERANGRCAGGPGRATRRIPIVALTASAIVGDKQKCLDAGMDGYCTKPIEAEQLIAIVKSFIDGTTKRQNVEMSKRQNVEQTGTEARRHLPAADTEGEVVQAPSPSPQSDSPIDQSILLARCSNNQTLAAKVLQTLDTKLSDAAREIAELAHERDLANIARIAHSVKGAAGMAGAANLHTVAADLESLSRQADAAGIEAQLSMFKTTVDECRRWIAEHQNTSSQSRTAA